MKEKVNQSQGRVGENNMKLLENARLDTLSAAISTDKGDSQIDGR